VAEALAARVAAALRERDGLRRRLFTSALRPPPPTIDQATEQQLERSLRDDTDLSLRVAAVDVAVALGVAVVPLMARLIRDSNARVRRLAIDVLGGLGKSAGPTLSLAFDDALVAVRSSAVDAWARVMGPAGVPTLIELLSTSGTAPSVALAALLGIEAAGGTCPRAVLRVWLDEPLTVGVAVRLAGRAGDVEIVLPALASNSPSRRRAALLGLAEALAGGARYVEVPGARPAMLDAVNDPDGDVAAAAVVILAHAGDVAALADIAVGHDAARLLDALHRALGVLGPEARAGLLALLLADATPGEVCRELIETVRRAAEAEGDARPPVVDDTLIVARWFEARIGLALDADSQARIRARLAPRLMATRDDGVGAYLERLTRDPVEAAVAIDAVTVHETYFFRERPVLGAFRDELIPALAQRRRRLRVWSAGCATGEEAFTIGALLDDAVRAGVIDDWEVKGTDVSPVVVERASQARYGRRSFRAPADAIERAAIEWDGDVARPNARLRERVRFAVDNLVEPGIDADGFDAIFCRNVFIYLVDAARSKLVQRFHDNLVPGGALLLGHSESLLRIESPFALWPLAHSLAYRKVST
jgi:chemotaxis protein methyltransferase CheR